MDMAHRYEGRAKCETAIPPNLKKGWHMTPAL
jgi:hypothetical protein